MSSLQIGLIAAGVALVVLVIVYNVWQERRLRRRLADSRRAAERSAAEASRRSAERVEPTLGTQRTAASRGQPAHRTAAQSETDFEPPLDMIAPPASEGIADDSPAAAMPRIEATEVLAESDELAPSVLARSAAQSPDARNVAQPDHEIEALIPLSPAAPVAGNVAQPDHEIEALIPLSPAAPVAAGALAAGLHARIGKPLAWFGRADPRSDWQPIAADTPGRFAELVACMLLADRNGAASRAQLESFARAVRDVAAALEASFTPPDLAQEAARAESLDRLCAELDVQIGLTVQMPEPASIPGTRLRGVAEAAGFRLSPAGRFEFVSEDTGTVLYTLQNLRPDAFSAEMLRLTATNGVVFLLDVARLPDPARAFDQMKMAAKRMAHTLGADLVDDNRRPLDDAALATIREQVQAAAEALRAVHIEPGSSRALALFSA